MKKIILFILAITMIVILNNNDEEYYVIPNDAIRFRVIPNSNNVYDQYIKLKVKNNIYNELESVMNGATTLDEARKKLEDNMVTFDKIVEDTLIQNNYDYTYKVNYGMNYFPEKEFKGVKYKEGMYESFVVTLGEGNGDNWWCVLFPPICFAEIEESDDLEYRFLVKDLVDKYFVDK